MVRDNMRIDLFSMMRSLLLLIVSDLINLPTTSIGVSFYHGAHLIVPRKCVAAVVVVVMVVVIDDGDSDDNDEKTSGRVRLEPSQAMPGNTNVINWNVLFTFDFVAALSHITSLYTHRHTHIIYSTCTRVHIDAKFINQLPSFSNMPQSIVVRLLFGF